MNLIDKILRLKMINSLMIDFREFFVYIYPQVFSERERLNTIANSVNIIIYNGNQLFNYAGNCDETDIKMYYSEMKTNVDICLNVCVDIVKNMSNIKNNPILPQFETSVNSLISSFEQINSIIPKLKEK